jgi:energy-coupling factor transporter ATP-binding protein EcfA2
MDLVYEYATRVLVLNAGCLVFDGTPDSLFKKPSLSEFHLDYPATIRVLREINERFHTQIDIYQKTVSDATIAIKRGFKS